MKWVGAGCLCIALWGGGAWAEGKPKVVSIEGDNVIVVIKPDGKNTTAERGTELEVGDHLRTGPHTSAVIRYADGSKLFLGRGTDVILGKNNGETQWNEVSYGQVRGMVPKPKNLSAGGPPRFAVRSRAAVMGVRGTDFVFQANEAVNQAEVRTIEGSVEVAKDEAGLLSGDAVSVKAGQYVGADGAKIGPVQKFNKSKYLKELEYQQPEMFANVQNDPDAVPKAVEAVPPPAPGANAPQSQLKNPESAAPPPDYGPRFRLLVFGLGATAQTELLNDGSGIVAPFFTGHLSWNPSLRVLWSLLHIRGHVGATLLKSQVDGRFFPSLQVAVMPALHFFRFWFVEAGLGAETWLSYGAPSWLVMANTGILLSERGVFERIYLGASVYDQDGGRLGRRMFVSFRIGISLQIPTGS
jgi:hypothetical protein